MDLSAAVNTLNTSVSSTDTGVPGLIGDMAPLIALGVVLSLFLGLIGRVLRI